jgi:hypothetical protein
MPRFRVALPAATLPLDGSRRHERDKSKMAKDNMKQEKSKAKKGDDKMKIDKMEEKKM